MYLGQGHSPCRRGFLPLPCRRCCPRIPPTTQVGLPGPAQRRSILTGYLRKHNTEVGGRETLVGGRQFIPTPKATDRGPKPRPKEGGRRNGMCSCSC